VRHRRGIASGATPLYSSCFWGAGGLQALVAAHKRNKQTSLENARELVAAAIDLSHSSCMHEFRWLFLRLSRPAEIAPALFIRPLFCSHYTYLSKPFFVFHS
jgi:hypothetical protein